MKYKPLKIGELVAQVPIVQGGMGIGISLGNLAGAVAKEGGVGVISAAQIGYLHKDFETNPLQANLETIASEFKKARDIAPKGIVGFNIMVAMRNYEEYVAEAVKVGADIIISGAGLPIDLPELVKESKTKIAPIVSTNKATNVILRFWDKKYSRTADMIVIEGPKAGGHLGFTVEQLENYSKESYYEEIKTICNTVREYEKKYNCHIPVVVGGGISDANEMEDVMNLGIQGVQVASRFVTTEECDASPIYKNAYIEATEDDIMIVKSPVGMPGRAISNPFIKRVMQGEKITPKRCLGCIHKCIPKDTLYCITDGLVNAAKGNLDEALLFCGADTYKSTKIETVKEVIDSLIN